MRTYFPHRLAAFAGLAAVAWIGGCSSNASSPPAPKHSIVTKTAPPTPIQKKRQITGGPTWNPHWDEVVEKAIPKPMLSRKVPRDVRRFCPRFYEMDKPNQRQFWAYFFQALAGAESGLDKTSNVHHLQPDVNVRDSVTGKLTHQEGLLQLSYKDSERYGCRFEWEADHGLSKHDPQKTILQPVNNLKCGIRILYQQIIEAGKPLLYKNSYWATLRPGTSGYYHFLKQMKNTPEVCRVAPRRRPGRDLARAEEPGGTKKHPDAQLPRVPDQTTGKAPPEAGSASVPPESANTKESARMGARGHSFSHAGSP